MSRGRSPGSHARRPGALPGHGHGHGAVPDVAVGALPRAALLVGLALAGVATVVGLVWLRPDSARAAEITDSVAFAAPGATFPVAVVDSAEEPCPTGRPGSDCGGLAVTVEDGVGAGEEVRVDVPPQVAAVGLDPGDRVELLRTPGAEGQPATYAYFGTERGSTLWLLLGIFVLVVVAVARWRGLFALVGLGFAGLVVAQFVLPALLVGESGLLVAVVGSSAIMFVVLYLTHGVSLRTSAALAGTLAGLGVTALIGSWSVRESHLTGVAEESGGVLLSIAGQLDFQGLLACAVVIAGLGVLNDVTITQSSAVWELRAAAPELSRRQVFASAMRIGRDHIASTIYTIVFAYAGTALLVLLVISLYDRPVLDLLTTEEIGQEVVRTLATSIGLVLAVPLTTLIASLTVPAGRQATA